MPDQQPTPPESNREEDPSSIPDHTDESDRLSPPLHFEEWVGKVVFMVSELASELGATLPDNASLSDYHKTFLQAVFDSLLDSEGRMENATLIELLGRVVAVRDQWFEEWNDEKNDHRMELIDKDIDRGLTIQEQIELASLTSMMRYHFNSEKQGEK